MSTNILCYGIGLIAGNYIYQAVLSVPNWAEANERSFFEAVAIIGAVIISLNKYETIPNS